MFRFEGQPHSLDLETSPIYQVGLLHASLLVRLSLTYSLTNVTLRMSQYAIGSPGTSDHLFKIIYGARIE